MMTVAGTAKKWISRSVPSIELARSAHKNMMDRSAAGRNGRLRVVVDRPWESLNWGVLYWSQNAAMTSFATAGSSRINAEALNTSLLELNDFDGP